LVHATAEVILYGTVTIPPELVANPRIRIVSDIRSSTSGAPFFDALVYEAALSGKYDLQAYMNCDIILTADFLERLAPVDLPEYLIIGQRIDLASEVDIDLGADDMLGIIRALAETGRAQLHTPTGVDYFVFHKGMWEQLEPLIIGRGGYDGALVAYSLRRKIPVIDVTWAVPALHQFHDYSHLKGGLHEAHRGDEALHNYHIHDVEHSTPDISDADYQLRDGRLIDNPCRGDWLRAFEIILRYRWGLKYTSYLVRALWRFSRNIGYNSSDPIILSELINGYTPISRI
jgi:hypothetical protein